MKGVLCVLVLCMSLIGTGCDSSSNQSAGGQPAAASVESPATTDAGETQQRPPGGPPPKELQGTWLTDLAGAPARLYIRDNRYTVSAGGSAQGDVVVDGTVIAFFNANGASCPPDPADDVGRYQWKIIDGKLRLRLLGKDPCGGRVAIMTSGPFERAG